VFHPLSRAAARAVHLQRERFMTQTTINPFISDLDQPKITSDKGRNEDLTDDRCQSVAICIPTRDRPAHLNELLMSISQIEVPPMANSRILIHVVDNHPLKTAQETVEKWQKKMPFSIFYAVEERPGVVHVRNKLLLMAQNNDYIVFVDDDEIVDKKWLIELLAAQKEFNADIVQGKMVLKYVNAPQWLQECKFFEMKRYEHGQKLPEAFTFNVMLSTKILKKFGIHFDERYNLSGSEDIQFFRRLSKKGAKIVYTDKAITYEKRFGDRITFKWYCKRAFRIGTTNVLVELDVDNPYKTYAKYIIYLFGRITQGVLSLAKFAVYGKNELVKAAIYFCLGAGNFYGLLGLSYKEYGRSYK
jgi:glycosyltransferase involved in cell wall biosynthesis